MSTTMPLAGVVVTSAASGGSSIIFFFYHHIRLPGPGPGSEKRVKTKTEYEFSGGNTNTNLIDDHVEAPPARPRHRAQECFRGVQPTRRIVR